MIRYRFLSNARSRASQNEGVQETLSSLTMKCDSTRNWWWMRIDDFQWFSFIQSYQSCLYNIYVYTHCYTKIFVHTPSVVCTFSWGFWGKFSFPAQIATVWWMFGCVFFVAPLNWWGKKYRTGPWDGTHGLGNQKMTGETQNSLGPLKFGSSWMDLMVHPGKLASWRQTWRFGRWFSFSIGWNLGSMSFNVNFPGCTTYAEALLMFAV